MAKYSGKDLLIQRQTVSGVFASLTTALTGTNNDITLTANVAGVAGNNIALVLVAPGTANQALTVSVAGTVITANLATNGASAVTTTAAQLVAALNNNVAVANLVTVIIKAGDDGSGVVTALASTPLAGGTASTFENVAAMKSTSMSINNEEVDVTDKGTMPWKQLLACGVRSMALSASGVFTNDQSHNDFVSDANSGAIVVYRIISGRGDQYIGPFLNASIERSGEHNGAELYSISLSSAGQIAYTAGP
jgi:predicted secreted protein